MPDEVDEGSSGGASQRYGRIYDRADGGCKLVGHTRKKNNSPAKGHTVGTLYKGGGELGCEGLQFVGGNKFCKEFCLVGLFHL